MSNCGCNKTISLCDCDDTGCPIQLDFSCILYHKSNSEISALTNLALPNGSSLELFAETLDGYIGQIKATSYSLPYLRKTYTINTLKQFAESVDTELLGIAADIEDLNAAIGIPLVANDSASINFTNSGTQGHTLTGVVKISATSNNLLSVDGTGLYSAPQTLVPDYVNKTLSITNGNTVSLLSLSCGVGGFLGNLASDPAGVIDGQYWYNTTSSQLKIRVNSTTKVITTS